MSSRIQRIVYQDIDESIRDEIFDESLNYVVVGVIGKSSRLDCNKMESFDILEEHVSLASGADPKQCYDGRISFYVNKNEKIVYLHIETTFDAPIMEQLVEAASEPIDFFQLNALIKAKFARSMLLLLHVCHILVLVDPGNTFDSSYLSLFRALNIIRERYVIKFLTTHFQDNPAAPSLGREMRLCSPRMIFLFEKPMSVTDELKIQDHEMELESEIYGLFKAAGLLNRSTCLLAFRKKIAFVHVARKREEPLAESLAHLSDILARHNTKNCNDSDISRPWLGFAKPFNMYSKEYLDQELENNNREKLTQKYSLKRLVRRHIKDILATAAATSTYGGDIDSGAPAQSRGKTYHHCTIPNAKSWWEIFEAIRKLMVINPGDVVFRTTGDVDPDYRSFLDNFDSILDTDRTFFDECCDEGFKVALGRYELNLRNHYSRAYHEQRLNQSFAIYLEYARGPRIAENMEGLRQACDAIWMDNRQLCECLSLRGNPCIMPKATHSSPLEHSSGVVYIATCNCGRTQARRDDPYMVKQANYDFYQMINCAFCLKTTDEMRIRFPTFEPSTSDFSAADLSLTSPDKKRHSLTADSHHHQHHHHRHELEGDDEVIRGGSNNTTPLTQQSHSNLSYEAFLNLMGDTTKDEQQKKKQQKEEDEREKRRAKLADEELNEIVVKVGEMQMHERRDRNRKLSGDSDQDSTSTSLHDAILRQPSTTEYLPVMVTVASPVGLLPRFPSWSLMCIGRSLLYSHNIGIQEHFQGKFLPGANFLLPWNVHVRLEHSSNWTTNYERSKNRKKQVNVNPNVFQLKIFIGFEYECPRGHRFIMAGPDKIMQGAADLTSAKNMGSKVAFNDMPLYFPCRCQQQSQSQAQQQLQQCASTPPAQLMRIHVVTPKAPVNVKLDPRIQIGRSTSSLVFVTGLTEPATLTPSNYWVLRLPYVYETEEGPILPPCDVDPSCATVHGCLVAGLFGIVESQETYFE